MEKGSARGWCFTLNNYTEAETAALLSLPVDSYDYFIVGQEVGAEGTPHLQGFIYGEKRRFASIKKMLGDRAHIEVAKGTPQQNKTYCSKEGRVLVEAGICPAQGKRKDIEVVREVLRATGRVADVVEVATSYQSIKAAECIIKYIEVPRTEVPTIIWLWGPTGTGKTRAAIEMCGADTWISGKNLKWWEGYDGHRNVIIDDFRADFCTFHELLRILDRYPYRVEVKGGSRQLLANRIVITSCAPPDQVYCTREDIGQLNRRITTITYVGVPQVVVPEVGGNTLPLPLSPGIL